MFEDGKHFIYTFSSSGYQRCFSSEVDFHSWAERQEQNLWKLGQAEISDFFIFLSAIRAVFPLFFILFTHFPSDFFWYTISFWYACAETFLCIDCISRQTFSYSRFANKYCSLQWFWQLNLITFNYLFNTATFLNNICRWGGGERGKNSKLMNPWKSAPPRKSAPLPLALTSFWRPYWLPRCVLKILKSYRSVISEPYHYTLYGKVFQHLFLFIWLYMMGK